jgi:hypothetical protein
MDSNHLPPRYQHGALPVELAAQGLAERLEDFEASTVVLEFTGSALATAFFAGRDRRRAFLGHCRR